MLLYGKGESVVFSFSVRGEYLLLSSLPSILFLMLEFHRTAQYFPSSLGYRFFLQLPDVSRRLEMGLNIATRGFFLLHTE